MGLDLESGGKADEEAEGGSTRAGFYCLLMPGMDAERLGEALLRHAGIGSQPGDVGAEEVSGSLLIHPRRVPRSASLKKCSQRAHLMGGSRHAGVERRFL